MRTDELYLTDIVTSANAISRYLTGFDSDRFLGDEVMRDAVLRRLIVIGEAASHVSEELRARYPSIAWRKARDFRNFAVHGYFSIQWSIVWETAIVDIPQLHTEVADVLAREFPANSAGVQT